jgi:hypothetical protein
MTTSGAWICIAWGVVATVMGLVVATDYRGLVGSMLAERARTRSR